MIYSSGTRSVHDRYEDLLKAMAPNGSFATGIGAPTDLLEVVSERFHKLAAAGDLQAEPAKLFVALLDEVGRK